MEKIDVEEVERELQATLVVEEKEEENPNQRRNFLLLIVVYIVYLVIGAAIFQAIEFETIRHVSYEDHPMWTEIKSGGEVTAEYEDWFGGSCPNSTVKLEDHKDFIGGAALFFEALEGNCPGVKIENVEYEYDYKLSFIDSLYFSMTVTTTIGYGHISPFTAWGKIVCMIYAILGVPLTGILLATTSEFFGERIFLLYKDKLTEQRQRSRTFITAATVLYLLVGFAVFIFLPAIVFHLLEDWTYLDSVYYAFITITTIGFGDLVSKGNFEDRPAIYALYQVIVIIWILVSLGYWVMVANFITLALRSKKLHGNLIRRAKLIKDLMAKYNNKEPVFLPEHTKGLMSFMMNTSMMLPGGVPGTGNAIAPSPGDKKPPKNNPLGETGEPTEPLTGTTKPMTPLFIREEPLPANSNTRDSLPGSSSMDDSYAKEDDTLFSASSPTHSLDDPTTTTDTALSISSSTDSLPHDSLYIGNDKL